MKKLGPTSRSARKTAMIEASKKKEDSMKKSEAAARAAAKDLGVPVGWVLGILDEGKMPKVVVWICGLCDRNFGNTEPEGEFCPDCGGDVNWDSPDALKETA
jgi:rubrerythrin